MHGYFRGTVLLEDCLHCLEAMLILAIQEDVLLLLEVMLLRRGHCLTVLARSQRPWVQRLCEFETSKHGTEQRILV